jgi:PAS domain-containing protein
MLGYANKPPQLTLDWWKESIHPDDKENALNTLHRITAGEISEYKIKYRLKTKTGQWKTILSAGMVVEYNTKGKPVCMVGMHTDFEDLLADI